jgi:hypothetical protein
VGAVADDEALGEEVHDCMRSPDVHAAAETVEEVKLHISGIDFAPASAQAADADAVDTEEEEEGAYNPYSHFFHLADE